MTGPTAGVRSAAELRRDESTSYSSYGVNLEEEPWDQRRRPSANDANNRMNNSNATPMSYDQEKAAGAQVERKREDGSLEDGDLPSLSAKGSGNSRNNTQVPRTGGRVVGGQRTTSRSLKPSSVKGLATPSPNVGRRKFRGQLEDSEGHFHDDSELTDDERDNRRSSRGRSGRKYVEEDGPDDEMEARRANSRGRPRQHLKPQKQHQVRALKDYDTDNSAATDIESQLTEEDEDGRYESSFCGQTLNAIDDLCGGSLNLTGNGINNDKERKQNKRSSTTSPPVGKNQRSSTSPSSEGNDRSSIARQSPRSSRSPPPLQHDDSQQEHTAIEVEFVEPIKTAANEESRGGAFDAQRKNAYLNAMAKKAKENFQNKKAKTLTQQLSQPNEAGTEIVQPKSPREIDSSVTDVEESATAVARSDNFDVGVGDDYNSFNAAEKHKFIKLINGGVIATDATRQIMDNRNMSQMKEQRPPEAAVSKAEDSEEKDRAKRMAAKVAARLAFWKRSHPASPSQLQSEGTSEEIVAETSEVGGQVALSYPDESANAASVLDEGTSRGLVPAVRPVEPAFQLTEMVVGNNRSTDDGMRSEGASVSDADSAPFQKSGSHYYDAVRREVDNGFTGVEGGTRGRDASRGLEMARAQRFFGAGKPKGFSALPDSPEKRSKSAPRQRLAADDGDKIPFSAHRQRDEASEARRIFGTKEVQSSIAGTLAVSKAVSALQEEGSDVKNLSTGSSADRFFRSRDVAAAGSTGLRMFDPKAIRLTLPTDDKEQTSQQATDRGEGAESPLISSSPLADSASSPLRVPKKEWDEADPNSVKEEDPIPSSLPTFPAFPTKSASGQESMGSRAESLSPRANAQVRAISIMDVGMDSHFSSMADAYSVSNGAQQHDNMSVYTAGTNITGATSYTQSSRVRRPGAAKTRLAKQKQIEQVTPKKVQGWHETIRAAAESTNRTWDPKKGWVDYEEPDAVPADLVRIEKGKIRVDLDRSIVSHKDIDSGQDHITSNEPTVPVPFPREWEKERDEMIRPPRKESDATSHQQYGIARYSDDQSRTAENEEKKLESTTTVETETAQSTSIEGLKSKGWIESMRAASASLAKEGKVWDPVHGWTSIDRNGADIPDIVDFEVPTFPAERSLNNEGKVWDAKQGWTSVDRNGPDVPDIAEFDIPTSPDERALRNESEAVRAIDTPNIQVNASLPERSLQERSGKSHLLAPLPPEDAGKKLSQWIAKKTEKAPKSRSELSTESSDRAVASVVASRRIDSDEQPCTNAAMQRRDESRGNEGGHGMAHSAANRNVPIFTQYESPGAEDAENDSAPLINQSSTFPSLDDRNIVDVVKEKVGEDDLDLFPRDDSKTMRGGHRQVSTAIPSNETRQAKTDDLNLSGESRVRVVAASETPRSNVSIMSMDLSSTASRRGVGPIDVDEVDETWDSDDEDRHSKDWLLDRHPLDRSGDSGVLPVVQRASQRVHDGEDEHRHIKDWKESTRAAMAYDARSVSTQSDEAGRTNEDWATVRSDASPSKKVPKLQRSKRDTSPLSVRKLPDGTFSGTAEEHPLDGTETETSTKRKESPFRTPNATNEQSLSPRSDPTSVTSNQRKSSPFRARNAANEQTCSPGSGRRLPVAAFPPNYSNNGPEDSFGEDSDCYRPKPATGPGGAAAKTILQEIQSPESPSVKARLQEWETRIEISNSIDAGEPVERSRNQPKDAQMLVGIAGWRSFLGKKVQAESAAAAAGQPKHRSGLMDTEEPEGDYSGSNQRTRGGADLALSREKQIDDDSLFEFVDNRRPIRNDASALDLSDLSPIRANDELSDTDNAPSEAYGPTEDERRSSSFLQRLTECAAPMMTTKQNHGESSISPSGHLAFFRPNSSGSARFVPTSLCGGQDVVDEVDHVAESSHDSTNSVERHGRSMSFGDEKPRSMPTSRDKIKFEAGRVSSSSVVSEDFGAKTAYLDSVAMKAAVSKPRRSSSSTRRRERSAGSSVASGSTDHSEKWKAFLERKRASGASPGKSRASSSDVSRAAEKYASEKVEEIMTKMSSRSRTVARSREGHKGVNDVIISSGEVYESDSMRSMQKGASVTAAEDLAAARVEAMMAALSTSHLDEGEI